MWSFFCDADEQKKKKRRKRQLQNKTIIKGEKNSVLPLYFGLL